MTVEPGVPSKNIFFILMIYAALFGALSSLLTVGYITLYSQGIKLFEQVSLMVLNINIWPLVLLTIAGVLIGLVIKFFGQNWRTRNCPEPVCPDWPNQSSQSAEHYASSIHIAVEWGGRWS
ncbi:MAG: hypothetical protein ACHQ1D_04005 [Nitrososphaerales archaeon]